MPAVGVANVNLRVTGPNGFALERNYNLATNPATQTITRRTVRTSPRARASRCRTICSPISCPAPAAVGFGRACRAHSMPPPAGAAGTLSVRLQRADRQPCLAAALCQRARGRDALALDSASRRPSATRSSASWRVRIPMAPSVCGRPAASTSGSIPMSRTSSPARANAAMPSRTWLQARHRAVAQLRRQCRGPVQGRRPRRSPMRSMCWRAMAPRPSATCAISPIPSSTISDRRLPGRRWPPHSQCSATRSAPNASMRRRCVRSRRGRRWNIGREDYGSALRDAAALVTLASEGGAQAATITARSSG